MQAFEVGHVGDDDTQQVVELARHEVALHDFRDVAYCGFESGQLALLLAMEADVDQHVAAESHTGLVEERDVAVDVTGILERADATQARRPVLLTSRGRGVAVMQSVTDYETAEEERAFMRAVVTGLADIEAGRDVSLAEVKKRLGLK